MKKIVVAITGASGSIYGVRVVEELLKAGQSVYLIVSNESLRILKHETGIDWEGKTERETQDRITEHYGGRTIYYYGEDNLWAPVSSGSFKTDGMAVVPCSMKSLAGIAHGYASNLIERAADVTLKEGRPLIICPRETPLSAIHLENMLKLARLGVRIIPPIPAFYNKPKTISDLIDFAVGRIMDSLNINHNLYQQWKSEE
ncbi:MAG TPA: flavin prenyltransferase UbiX [Thermodesulfovibrionia bacterium]|nr:flavin prenyltransferase UbiX [Thermodesulfovibrionia bacterium]